MIHIYKKTGLSSETHICTGRGVGAATLYVALCLAYPFCAVLS